MRVNVLRIWQSTLLPLSSKDDVFAASRTGMDLYHGPKIRTRTARLWPAVFAGLAACWFVGCHSVLQTYEDWETTQMATLQALQEGRHSDAEALILKALKQAESFGPNDPRLARTLMNKDLLAFRRTRFGEEESAWQRSSKIFEQSLGPESADLAASLNNMGLVYLAQGKATDAEPLFSTIACYRRKGMRPEPPRAFCGSQ